MGYFDALTSSYFKTAQDGRKLFFPWGVLGRGYILPSDADYERRRRQTKIYTIVSLVLIIGAATLQTSLAWLFIPAALIAFYQVWVRYLLRGHERSDERLSFRESMTSQARAHSATALWLLEIVSLAFVGSGVAILILDPAGRSLPALASIVFFGLCAAAFTFMLIARNRQAAR